MPVRVRLLLRQLKSALHLLPRPLPPRLTELQFVLIDRAEMARVHADFLRDPTETDVITFPYGEILICPAVARDRASNYGLEIEQEVLLYALHGLLHLTGYDDKSPEAARLMNKAQGRLLKRVLEA